MTYKLEARLLSGQNSAGRWTQCASVASLYVDWSFVGSRVYLRQASMSSSSPQKQMRPLFTPRVDTPYKVEAKTCTSGRENRA